MTDRPPATAPVSLSLASHITTPDLMARLARVVIPGVAHHVTQRGNGQQRTFDSADDYALYLRLLRAGCERASVVCLAYCLMPNHVHMILVPQSMDGLRDGLALTHRAYAGILNARRGVTGHFWQGRFGSVVMDDDHLFQALRYVLLNPVRARLVRTAADWRWSSARAYLARRSDAITDTSRMLPAIAEVPAYLAAAPDETRLLRIRAGETCGWPAAEPAMLEHFEAITQRRLRPRRPGPPPRALR